MSITNIIKTLLERLNASSRTFAAPGTGFAASSFSQCGEDVIVRYLFRLRGIDKPSYLDLGAHAPFYLSNTALFYLNGSRGVNIEPNPDLIASFTRERPLDINLNIGISSKEGCADFFCMEDSTLSTFSKHERDRLVAFGHSSKSTLLIKTLPIDKIVDRYCGGVFPDFLSIDVEGLELEIMESVKSMTSHPKVICVETANYSPIGAGNKRKELMRLIDTQGYFLYADTNLNSIYVRSDFWKAHNDKLI
jgi:FkbM family methyltransferase